VRPNLQQVTLVAVSGVAIEPTLAALEKSMNEARFAKVLFLSDREPEAVTGTGIEWRRIDPIRNRSDYSRFMLRGIADHVETTHALCVQWDGFVLDGKAWEPRFVDYDYIGAVWPQFHDGHNVGNGGFSLRSKRLLEACRELPFDGSQPEDVFISRECRHALEEQGIRFAPEEIARQFSYERTECTGEEFGFHGAFNLVRYLSPSKAADLFRSLEPSLLTPSEHWELLRWALLRGRGMLALAIASRLLRRQLGTTGDCSRNG
jgi:hypothetical protein